MSMWQRMSSRRSSKCRRPKVYPRNSRAAREEEASRMRRRKGCLEVGLIGPCRLIQDFALFGMRREAIEGF